MILPIFQIFQMATLDPTKSDNASLPSNSATNELQFPNKTIPLLIIGGVTIGSMLVHLLLTFILRQISKKTGWLFDREVLKHW